MKDIASELGVSIVTVSKVLNGEASISAMTRKRVLECAARMNYRTNLAAKGLVTGESRVIGLIVPELFHGFFGEVAASISECLREQGYGLIISSSRDDAGLEREEIQQMAARNVDALILVTCEIDVDRVSKIASDLPTVFLDRRVAGERMTYVGTNDVAAGEIATGHLIEAGCRRLAFIGGPRLSIVVDREAGFAKAVQAAGLPLNRKLVRHLMQNEEATDNLAADCVRALLRSGPKFDGLFCYNDPTAHGAMQAITEAGLRIPEDVAVIGCGNIRYNRLLRVPLSSIDQQASQLGTQAARLALVMIGEQRGGSPMVQRTVLFEPVLVQRESTGKRGIP